MNDVVSSRYHNDPLGPILRDNINNSNAQNQIAICAFCKSSYPPSSKLHKVRYLIAFPSLMDGWLQMNHILYPSSSSSEVNCSMPTLSRHQNNMEFLEYIAVLHD